MKALISIDEMQAQLNALEEEGIQTVDMTILTRRVLAPATINRDEVSRRDVFTLATVAVITVAILYFGGHLLWWYFQG